MYSRALVQSRERPDGSVILEGVVQDITELREVEAELIRSEERHLLLAENAWEMVWTMGLDSSITYISPAVERMRGFTPEEARRQTPEQMSTPESAARIAEYYHRVFVAIEAGTPPPRSSSSCCATAHSTTPQPGRKRFAVRSPTWHFRSPARSQ